MSWSRIEKELWDKSEVWQEFNKQMTKAAAGLNQELQQVQQNATPAAKSLGEVERAANSLANIEFADDPALELESEEIEEDPQVKLLEELNMMVRQAIEQKDIKQAYMIERAIQEITQDE